MPAQACTQVLLRGQEQTGWRSQLVLFQGAQTCYPYPMDRELAHVTRAIRVAGQRAMELAQKGFDVQTKKDRSPVTTADLEVDRILREMQQTHFPDDGWLSEESPDDQARLLRPTATLAARLTSSQCPIPVAVGLSTGVLGQVGDLLQSRIKRLAQVKDSGSILPGHGGVLDRLDSFLFSSYPSLLALYLLAPDEFHVKQWPW